MTEYEILIRARAACAAGGVTNAADYLSGELDGGYFMHIVLLALRGLDKPIPVDPDLLEAREICAKSWEVINCIYTAQEHRDGDYDDGAMQTLVLAGIKRGRALESGKA